MRDRTASVISRDFSSSPLLTRPAQRRIILDTQRITAITSSNIGTKLPGTRFCYETRAKGDFTL